MSREWLDYYEDMIVACESIIQFSENHTKESFCNSKLHYDATIRNIEVLGEAAKLIPTEIRSAIKEIPWTKLIALRNIVIHDYFEIDDDILWDVIINKIPKVLEELNNMPRNYSQFFKKLDL
jgi:uncharacterized protein with HEPN domain